MNTSQTNRNMIQGRSLFHQRVSVASATTQFEEDNEEHGRFSRPDLTVLAAENFYGTETECSDDTTSTPNTPVIRPRHNTDTSTQLPSASQALGRRAQLQDTTRVDQPRASAYGEISIAFDARLPIEAMNSSTAVAQGSALPAAYLPRNNTIPDQDISSIPPITRHEIRRKITNVMPSSWSDESKYSKCASWNCKKCQQGDTSPPLSPRRVDLPLQTSSPSQAIPLRKLPNRSRNINTQPATE